MKIPFSIKYRSQIESGEYKVCIDYDWPVEILSWDCIHVNRKGKAFPILAKITCMNPGEEEDFIHWYNNEGKYDPWDGISSTTQDNDCVAYCPGHDLFIVTPEPEMTAFEKKVYAYCDGKTVGEELIKRIAKELLDIARKELVDDMQLQFDDEINESYYRGRKEGKAEALITHAMELTENLVKSGLDKDSISYHLIEFMCNLYDCPNWKEIEETAEAYVTRIKAAAMKDLPRWIPNKFDKHNFETCKAYLDTPRYLCYQDRMIDVSELVEKLPGFKED